MNGHMNRYSTILWDVDDTLLDFTYSQEQSLARCFRLVGREITAAQIERYSQINADFWRRLELGEITKAELLTGRFEQFFREYGYEDIDLGRFLGQYQEGLGSIYAYLDDSLALCRELKGRVSQYVITNGVAGTQRSKLQLSGLADLMDGIFISEEIGAPKPQGAFFAYCLEHIQEKDPARVLVVGDSLSSDIKGGIQAGLCTCWYRKEGAVNGTGLVPDHEISHLHEILGLLE